MGQGKPTSLLFWVAKSHPSLLGVKTSKPSSGMQHVFNVALGNCHHRLLCSSTTLVSHVKLADVPPWQAWPRNGEMMGWPLYPKGQGLSYLLPTQHTDYPGNLTRENYTYFSLSPCTVPPGSTVFLLLLWSDALGCQT